MKQIFLVTLLFAFFFNTKTEAQVGSGLDTLTLVNGYRLVEYASGVTFAKTWFTNVDPYHGRFSQFFEVGRNTPNVANVFTYYAVFKKKLKNRIKVEILQEYRMKYADTTPIVSGYSKGFVFGVAFGNGDTIDSYTFSDKDLTYSNFWTFSPMFRSSLDSMDCIYIRISGGFKNTVVQVDYFISVPWIFGPPISVIEDFEDSTITNIIENESNIPTNFSLSQNYPNPFNPITNIKFVVPESGNYRLEVFNALGQKVETLLDSFLYPGIQECSFNGANFPSGTYFYRLTGNSISLYKKMILMK